MKFIFFRSGKWISCIRRPARCFSLALSLLGQGGLILLLVAINSAAWFYSARLSAISRRRNGRSEKCLALRNSESAGDRLYLVQLSPRPAEPCFARADAWRFFCAAREPTKLLRGGLIAVAAAIKAFPVIAIVYLLYRRYWIAAVSLVVTLVFLLLILPAPLRGFEQAWRDIEKWSAGMLKYSETSVGAAPHAQLHWKNQSLVGVSNRLLRRVDADAASAPHQPIYVNLANLQIFGRKCNRCWHRTGVGQRVHRGNATAGYANRGDRCDRVRFAPFIDADGYTTFVRLFLFLG